MTAAARLEGLVGPVLAGAILDALPRGARRRARRPFGERVVRAAVAQARAGGRPARLLRGRGAYAREAAGAPCLRRGRLRRRPRRPGVAWGHATGDTFRPVAATCAYAGLRASEALGLRWRDVDLTAGTLTVTGQLGTTGERIRARTAASVGAVPMLPALALELRRHRRAQASRNLALVHRDALVFTTATGNPQNHRNALQAVHEAGDRAKLNGDERPPVGLHDLRHSFVAPALASGLTLPEASALAGHANPRITAMARAAPSRS